MNILTRDSVPRRLFNICFNSLNEFRRVCDKLPGNHSASFKQSDVMITGVCNTSAQCLRVAYDLVDDLYSQISFQKVHDPAVHELGDINLVQEYLKETHSEMIPITKGPGNVAKCRVFVGGVVVNNQFDIDVVLTMHEYKAFKQVSFTLDIVIEDAH